MNPVQSCCAETATAAVVLPSGLCDDGWGREGGCGHERVVVDPLYGTRLTMLRLLLTRWNINGQPRANLSLARRVKTKDDICVVVYFGFVTCRFATCALHACIIDCRI